MAHSLGYPTDIDRKPDRKERSQRKQRSPCDVAGETSAYVSTALFFLKSTLL